MAKSQRWNILLLVLGLFLVYWTTKPDDHIAFDRSCNIVGMRAELSEAIYGDAFWHKQLDAADELLRSVVQRVGDNRRAGGGPRPSLL